MEKLLKELREIADKAEAAEKLHWAKSIREAAGKFGNLLRAADKMRDAVNALPQDKIIPLATAQCDLADAIMGMNTPVTKNPTGTTTETGSFAWLQA